MTGEYSKLLKNRNRKTVFRYLFYISAILCFAGGLLLFNFTQQFVNAPTRPDKSTGNVVAWNNHGTYHYITSREDTIKNAIITFDVIMFFCTALFGYIDQKKE